MRRWCVCDMHGARWFSMCSSFVLMDHLISPPSCVCFCLHSVIQPGGCIGEKAATGTEALVLYVCRGEEFAANNLSFLF